MMTSFYSSDIHAADRLADVLSLSHEQLHQCAWLSELESAPCALSDTTPATAATEPARVFQMPKLTQLIAAAHASPSAHAAAIQQFAAGTASALLESMAGEPACVRVPQLPRTSQAAYTARARLVARALRCLEQQAAGTDYTTTAASSSLAAGPRAGLAPRATHIRETTETAADKALLSPRTRPASFSGGENESDAEWDKPPFMVLYLKDDALSAEWLTEHLTHTISEAHKSHATRAAATTLLEALTTLVPHVAASERAAEALLRLYTAVLSVQPPANEPTISDFATRVALPLLYALPLLPWRSHQLPALSQLLSHGTLTNQAALTLPTASRTRQAAAAATTASSLSTCVHVRLELRGPSEALAVVPAAPQATASFPSASAAAETDSERFFEIPETFQSSPAPYSLADELAEMEREVFEASELDSSAVHDGDDDLEPGEEESDVQEGEEEEGDEDDENMFEDASEDSQSEASVVTGDTVDTVDHTQPQPTAYPSLSLASRAQARPPTGVTVLAATGPVQQLTVRVEHVAEGLAEAAAAAAAASAFASRVSLLVCPLPPSPFLEGDSPALSTAAQTSTVSSSSAVAAAAATVAVPLVAGEVVACTGPCRVVAAAPEEVTDASRPSIVLVAADLAFTLRLPALNGETLTDEFGAALAAAQSVVAYRLLEQVKCDVAQWTTTTSTTTASTLSSTQMRELLRGGLRVYAPADEAALATKAATEASAALAGTSDDELRRQVRCLAADLPAVRAALRIAAFVLWPRVSFPETRSPPRAATLDWQRKEWKEVLRRAHTMSTSLSHCPTADALADFVLAEVTPSGLAHTGGPTPSQVMSQIQQLFNSAAAASPDALRQSLESRHTTARTIQCLLRVLPAVLKRHPAVATALLIELLLALTTRTDAVSASAASARVESPFLGLGGGAQCETELSRAVSTLVLSVIDVLCGTLDTLLPLAKHSAATGKTTGKTSGACGVLASPPETVFVVLGLALLVLRRDAREAVLADGKRRQLLLELLPGGAHLDVAPSLPPSTFASFRHLAVAVAVAERTSFALTAALNELAVTSELAETGAEMFDGAMPELPAALDIGVPHVGPLAYLTPLPSPNADAESLPKLPKVRSTDPVMYPGAHRLYERLFNVSFTLHRFHTRSTQSRDGALWLGLTPLPPTRSIVELLNDNKAILVRPAGLARVDGRTVPFPAFGEGDTIDFHLAHSSEGLEASVLEPCVLVVSVNGIEVLTVPAPLEPLYLVAASTEDVSEDGLNGGAIGIRLSPIAIAEPLPIAAVHHQCTGDGALSVARSTLHGTPATADATQSPPLPPPSSPLPFSAPTLLKTLGFAYHVLQYLLTQAHRTASVARSTASASTTGPSLSPTPWRAEAVSRPPAPSSAEALASQLLSAATLPLARRARHLLQCLDAQPARALGDAPWHRQGSDRRAMATWVSARCRRQLYQVLLDAIVDMLCIVLRDNPSATEAAAALIDVVATQPAPDKVKALALASLLTAIQAGSSPSSTTNNNNNNSGSNSGGFGLFALDPSKLWSACVPLAASVHSPGYRPRFATSTVDARIAVAAGGRRVEYKSQSGTGPQPTANYALDGIVLDGSMDSDVVTFSVRLQRGYRMDSLCRHYHIGVACCRPQSITSTLPSHPGDRSRQFSTYTLSDYFNDAPDTTRAELRRYHQHWMTSDIVYGSGDVVTVVVHTRRRTIGFARNGKYLGTLYRNIPSSVCVLFPYVELINRDSKGKWMHPVRELALYARSTLRAMLAVWWPELTPKLADLLDGAAKGNSTGLEVLGSDGNELSMVYRSPPPSEGHTMLQHVRLVRMDGAFSVVEPDNAAGVAAGSLRVWTAALEPLFTAELPSAPPVVPFVDRLLSVACAMVPRDHREADASGAFVLHPGAFLRTLRLLATVTVPRESEAAAAAGEAAEMEMEHTLRRGMQRFVQHLIWLLQAKSSHASVDVALIEAFNEASWLPRDDAVLPLTFAASSSKEEEPDLEVDAATRTTTATTTITGLSRTAAPGPESLPLLCPGCGEPWATCTHGHAPPESMAALCDCVLRRLGVPSPFTGWLTSWTSSPQPASPAAHAPFEEAALSAGVVDDDGDDDADQDDDDDTDPDRNEAKDDEDGDASDGEDNSAVPEELGQTEGNYAVTSPTVLTVRACDDADDAAGLRVSCRCKYGSFEATASVRSTTAVKGRVTFKQSGWVDDADTGVPEGEWSCDACTFVNESGSTRCAICTTARPGAVWTCSTCTYAFNPNSSSVCTTCGQLRYAGLARLAGRTKDNNVSFCESCHASEEYSSFRHLRRRRFCTACDQVTTWLPKRKHTGTMELLLGARGDVAELVLHVEKATLTLTDLHATDYSTAQLSALVLATDPATPLARYVPPIAALRGVGPSSSAATTTTAATIASAARASLTGGGPLRLPQAVANLLMSAGGGSGIALDLGPTESYMRTAIIYYASLITLKWAPLMDANLFATPAVLRRVRVFDESWLAALDDLSAGEARQCLQTCFKVLFFDVPATGAATVPEMHVVATTAAVARALIRPRPCLQPLRAMVLYALARIAAATPTDTACREVCCTAITKLFEDAPLAHVNVQCLSPIHPLRPMVPGQRRALVFSLLRGAELQTPLTSTTATCCLVKALDCMTRGAPVPAVLDMDVTTALPYVVALAETTLNEGGDLQVGQVRGSLGIAPTTGGKYYYEIVLPSNFDDGTSNTIVMGWGTQQHEHLSSTQHVGSDLNSWGFNCRDRLRLMMGEQPLPTSQAPTAGDVIGSMMDLSTMMVCWTINGEEIMWVSVPSQGDSEKIYPYVSASVEPCGVEVRLAYTQFRPESYQDYTPAATHALWGHASAAAPPQSYDFYRQLCVFLSEAGISELDMTNADNVGATLSGSRKAQQELHTFPVIRAVVAPPKEPDATGRVAAVLPVDDDDDDDAEDEAVSDVEWTRLNPYITHLRAVSNLAVRVTQVFSSVKASPFLSEMYDRARDLFLSGVRWTLFESQLGIRPTFSSRAPMTVEIDLEKAKAALQRTDTDGFVHKPATRFADSVTGQLFAQTKLSKIYKNAAMFAVKLAGDVAVDGGGVSRSVLSMIADELTFQVAGHQRVDPAVPLFKLCGHSTIFTDVPNMELILGEVPSTSASGAPVPADASDALLRGGDLSGDRLDEAAVAAAASASDSLTVKERQEQAAQALQALTWLGRIIGNLTLCGTMKLPLVWPRLVWKFLTFKEVTIQDYFYDIDDTVRGALEDEDFLLDDDLFYTIPGVSRRGSGESGILAGLAGGPASAEVSSAGAGASLSELDNNTPGIYAFSALGFGGGVGGGSVSAASGVVAAPMGLRGLARGVSMAALPAFHPAAAAGARAVPGGLRQARFLTPAASMQNMSRIMTAMSALDDMEDAHASLQAEELKQRLEIAQNALIHQFDPALQAIRTGLTSVIPASALQSIRWDDLQSRVCGSAHCSADQILSAMDCTRIPEELTRMLTTVLDDFDDKQRSLFLLFCAGQSRLPLPEQISVICGDDATQLPTAHTCSPISLRLQPYTTVGQLRHKLEVCLQNAKQFGFV